MNFRKIIIQLQSTVFTIFLVFQFVCFQIIGLILPKSTQTYQQVRIKIRILQAQHICLTDIVQSILDSSLSLIYAYLIKDYHKFILMFLKVVTHRVHQLFIGKWLIIPFNLFNIDIFNTISEVLIWIYLIVGYFGLTMQLALTLDLIYLFNLPTIVVYKILAWLYSNSLSLLGYLFVRIHPNKQKWLTNPLHQFHTYPSIQLLSMILCILLVYFIFFLVFYYAWLTLVIVALRILINLLKNFKQLMSYGGCILIWIKNIRKNKFSIKNLQFNKFIDIITIDTIAKIFKGQDIMDFKISQQKQHKNNQQIPKYKLNKLPLKNIFNVLTQQI